MFTKDDYENYFNELENLCRESIVIYTDLINELTDRSIRNKLNVLVAEDLELFKFIKSKRGIF